MNATGINNFENIVKLIRRSNFFCEKDAITLKNTLLTEIKINSIDLPFRLKCFAHKQGIVSLEKLLNTKLSKIIRCRNIGIRTIVESRKIIIDHLDNMRDFFRNLEFEGNIVVTYFPFIKGFFRTTRLNFNFVYKDLSCIEIPKKINEYINEKKKLKIIYDLLNINYDELKKEKNIGHKTLGKLQSNLVSLLSLERVIFLGKPKKYELITIPKVNSPLPLNSVSASVIKFV